VHLHHPPGHFAESVPGKELLDEGEKNVVFLVYVVHKELNDNL
jgi:hypothetical protein